MSAPFPEFYNATDSATISATISATKNAGDTLAAVVYHLWNDKTGSHSSTTLKNARLIAEANDGLNWVRSGLPCLDEAWLQVQLTGQDSTGDPAMEQQTSAYYPLGTNRALSLRDIPANCARFVSAQIVIPAGTSTSAPSMRLVVIYGESSFPLGGLTSLATGGGVLPDWFVSSNRRLTRGRGLTAAGTAVVTVTRGGWVVIGIPNFRIQDLLTLNQTSGSGALGVGESYIAVISQPPFLSSGATVAAVATKGNKGSSPTTPATPAGDIYLGKVTVAYQGGGTSIINTGNLDMTGVSYGEFNPVAAATGLTITVGAGRAISNVDTQIILTAPSTVTVGAGNFYLWLNADGTFTTSASSPNDGAILIASYTDSAGNITGVTDYRNFVGHETCTLTMRYMGPSPTPAVAQADWDYLKAGLWILESYAVRAASVVNATNVLIDIGSYFATGVGFSSIFKNSGTDDLRPVLGQTGSDSFEVAANHEEMAVGSTGTLRYAFDFISGTAGGATDVEVKLFFRRQF